MSRGGKRPGAGRKKTEPAVKKLRGTGRADRDGEAPPPPVVGAMVAPIHLSDLGQLLFGSIAKILEQQGRASPHYNEIVALLAQRLEQIQRYQAVIDIEGDTYSTESVKVLGRGTNNERTIVTKLIRKHPIVAMLGEAMRHAHSLLAELMITPATALRLGEGQKPEDNPFEALANF